MWEEKIKGISMITGALEIVSPKLEKSFQQNPEKISGISVEKIAF